MCCDDILGNIFSRLPARTAVACTALSKHHRRLVTSGEFRRLHLLLGAPLPRPHVTYLAMAPITRRGDDRTVSKFYGFHVAGAGMGIGHAPMRALTVGRYWMKKYVNTCNGVILLAEKMESSKSFILWNPAIADGEKDETIHASLLEMDYRVAGLGYGRRSKTFKLLLCRNLRMNCKGPPGPRKPIYHCTQLDSIVFAFNVDDETVTSIDLPGEHSGSASSKLMEMSGRVCVVTNDGPHTISLWLGPADRRWVRRCAIKDSTIYRPKLITGAWDCGGVILLLANGYVYLYDITAERMTKARVPSDVSPEKSAYAVCWGYRPTLVSPGSIAGELVADDVDEEEEGTRRRRDRTASDILAAVRPVRERDVRRGRKATLDVTCFMEMLVRIMGKLPDGLQDVIDVPLLNASLDGRFRFSYED
uniref:F-box associated domain-containing protein n=1 Tax=Oryza brachyantha TaxID=4533 RepID=J3M0X0_ORYBR